MHIPGGTKHAWRNPRFDWLEVIVATTPKLGRYLREMCEFVGTNGKGYIEKLQTLSRQYGYWLGSPEENAAVGIPLEEADTEEMVEIP